MDFSRTIEMVGELAVPMDTMVLGLVGLILLCSRSAIPCPGDGLYVPLKTLLIPRMNWMLALWVNWLMLLGNLSLDISAETCALVVTRRM